jgi:2-oxoglutarate dehydrogenase E2 component (dihydrolipoamide succinyltransferase)
MGESVAEGTIVRWIKKLGDEVARDEPLFEISTDKVDAEIPSPVAGVLAEIRVREGETVPVNSIVAVIGSAADRPSVPSPPTEPGKAGSEAPAAEAIQSTAAPVVAAASAGEPRQTPEVVPTQQAAQQAGASTEPGGADAGRLESAKIPPSGRGAGGPVEAASRQPESEAPHHRSSPLVRKIARDNNIDISRIQGTGISGRVTKNDILQFIEHSRPAGAAAPSTGAVVPTARAQTAPPPARSGQTQPMSVMRKKIAEHMVASRRTSAHVHSVFEVNFTRVASVRDAKKNDYERVGAKLTYLSFIISATAAALRDVPIVNASIDGDNIVYHEDVNIGIAVALDWGLIVPVIKSADRLDLFDISRAVADLANRARTKQLRPEEVSGGTFTITNPGVFGALSGTPIINQPQVAILGVGVIEKRPVVIDDAIAIRPMAYLTLGYDHRLIDGAVADQFMSGLKHRLETWPGQQPS